MMVLPRRNRSKKTDPFWWSAITIGSLDLFSDLFSQTLKQCNQYCHSIPVAPDTFSQTMIQRNDQKDVMHLVSPFRSKLGNEMQEMIVFLKLVYNGPLSYSRWNRNHLTEASCLQKISKNHVFPVCWKSLAKTKMEDLWKGMNSKLHSSTKSGKSIFSVCGEKLFEWKRNALNIDC